MLNPYAVIRPASRANFLMLDRRAGRDDCWREGKYEWGERDHISSLLIGQTDNDARARAAPLGPLPRDAKTESTVLEDMLIREPKVIAQVLRCL